MRSGMKLKTIEKHRHRRLAICDAAIDLGRLRDAVEDQDDWEAIMAHVLSPTSELDDSFRPGAIAASKVLDTLKRAVGAPEYSGAEQEVSELLENGGGGGRLCWSDGHSRAARCPAKEVGSGEVR